MSLISNQKNTYNSPLLFNQIETDTLNLHIHNFLIGCNQLVSDLYHGLK